MPNTSPDMSPMPTTVKGSRDDVPSQGPEMPFHGLPSTPGGDAQFLVVVAGRTSRRESITEPIPVLRGKLVGNVGEGGGAFVGGNHEVGVLAVVYLHARRVHHPAADQIVGHVEQPAHEHEVSVLDRVLELGGVDVACEARIRPLSRSAR